MKLLVVLSRFPFPLEKGDKLRAYHQLVHLHENYEVTLCCITDKFPNKNERLEIEKVCTNLHVFKLNKLTQLFRLAYAVFSSRPFQVHYFYQKKIASQIKTVIQETKPDHIYSQLVRTTEYVKNFHEMPKTLDYMDALNKNYSRRISGAKGIKRILVKEEAKRLVAYENLIFNYFENHTIISEQDKNLIYHEKRDSIRIVPNGVDYSYFSPINPEVERTTDLLFTGNMGYLPNEDAALFLIKDVMPKIWAHNPQVNLTIAGANPSQELLNLKEDRITITGWVDDIRHEFYKAKVFLAPMRQGTGLQNKLLEAMSMKLPSVTTALANNALKASPNEHLYVYDDTEHLVSLTLHLLNDDESRINMGKSARQFILDNYSWESANKILQELITP